MQLNLPTMQNEQWDADKLRLFINHYGLLYKDVAQALGKSNNVVNDLLNSNMSFSKYESLLTAYKNALIVSRIQAAKEFCNEMITYYSSF